MNGAAHIVIGSCGGSFAIKFFPEPADFKDPGNVYNHKTIIGKCIKEVIENANKITKIDVRSEEYINGKL